MDEGTRIIGGEKASPLEYPYQAALALAPRYNYICSGSIITAQWVLTAGHCLMPFLGNYSELRVGIGNIFLDKMTYLSVESAIIHEDYNDLRIDDVSMCDYLL
ncbi:Serine protease 28 [Portunus trituberculatus]|uniref:Serine protease 28 n=1 Tax=Portunus trituberculatus TaxID=210409 RepID=A0A5B7JMP2_PORTR|nr:Serine protease 28 [Portunus trituberculatus]